MCSFMIDVFYKIIILKDKLIFYMLEGLTGLWDNILMLINVREKTLLFSEIDKVRPRIVFIGQQINFRIIKHIKWLSDSGRFEIILLQSSLGSLNNISHLTEVRVFRNKTHLKRMLKHSRNISFIYSFAAKSSYLVDVVKQRDYPVLYDPYDCISVYYGKSPTLKWMKKEVVAEEFCFQNTQYIVARNLEAQATNRIHGINKKSRHRILFSDYCDSDQFVCRHIEPSENLISIVYAGGIYGKGMQKSSHYFNDFFPIMKIMRREKIHFHIYPGFGTNPKTLSDFSTECATNSFIHLHTTVEQKSLPDKLAKYHFGVLPHFKEPGSPILESKLIYGTSLKFFNFLEAGIPILVSEEMVYMAWLVKRYSIGIIFNIGEGSLSEIILASDYKKLKQNVLKVREKLSMQKNINRLISFIESANLQGK